MTVMGSMRNTNLLGVTKTPYVPYDIITVSADSSITVTSNGTNCISAFKPSGTYAWDSQIYSSTSYVSPCTIEFSKLAPTVDVSSAYAMIGWNVDPTTNSSYTSLDYAAYPYLPSFYSVYHNGSQVSSGQTWDPTKRFYISYDTSGNLKHWNGSTLLFSVNYGTGRTVYLDTSFCSTDPVYSGFSNIRITKLSWNGNAYVNT